MIHSPLDEKPKRSADVTQLARVRDIRARPGVALLFDRWSERWSELAWVRLEGEATIIEPVGSSQAEHREAVERLRDRYPQYRDQGIENRPMIRVAISGHRRWDATRDEGSEAPRGTSRSLGI